MSGNSEHMDNMQADILREIANIGAGHASTALSMMLETTIEQTIPEVSLVALGDMIDLLGGAERVVVGVSVVVSGDIEGFLIMLLDVERAKEMIQAIRNQPPELDENGELFSYLDRSALKETLNIMAGSYLTAIAQLTNLDGIPSPPSIAVDMLGAILSQPLAAAGESSDFVLYFKSGLFGRKIESDSGSDRFAGDLLLVPNKKSYQTLLNSLGCG